MTARAVWSGAADMPARHFEALRQELKVAEGAYRPGARQLPSVSLPACLQLPYRLVPSFKLPAGGACKLPEAPILYAGVLGGPLVVGASMPLRNACALAAQDASSSVVQIYRRVFSRGLAGGWIGAMGPSTTAAVQFTALGPGYRLFLNLCGHQVAAVACTAAMDAAVSYTASARSAQRMHNSVCRPEDRVRLVRLRPVGPGSLAMLMRNCCEVSGIRVLSEPLTAALCRLAPKRVKDAGMCKPCGDFLSSVGCGILAMPLNQVYNYQVTSAASLEAKPTQRLRLGLQFLRRQYITRSRSGLPVLSRLVVRDAVIRGGFMGVLFSSFAAIERTMLALS